MMKMMRTKSQYIQDLKDREKRTKICHCGQQLKFHDENSDEPITMDIEETEGSFYWCPSCGIQEVI